MLEKFLEGLDDYQKMAVLSDSGRTLVVAPPGSGKTRVLASRCARLIEEGERPEKILAVTFTNRAAIEMRERIEGFTGMSPERLNVGTFHSFCLKLLRQARPGFALYGREDAVRLLQELGVKGADKAASFISRAKNTMETLRWEEKRVFDLYNEGLRGKNALDLDDLMLEALKGLETGEIRTDLSHVMVDEFQDINPVQARLVRVLARESKLFAIGDPDQAIYAFRGADLKTFTDFGSDFPGCEVIRLSANYRSCDAIVASSQSVIRNNLRRIENEVSSLRPGGEVCLVNCEDERAQGEFIAKEIEREMGGLRSLTVRGRNSARFSDFAVLTRTNRQAERLSLLLSRSSIPFHLVRTPGPCFKEFLSHLRSAASGMPEGETVNIPAFIENEGALLGVPEEVLRLFSDTARTYGSGGMGNFLDEMTLLEPWENLDVRADQVNVMTLHMAKGLEFSAVFIAGFEEGLMPLKSADVEEERRLFYVGLTRAREKAYLLSGRKRTVFGKTEEAGTSPFAGEIPERYLSVIDLKKKPVKRRPAQKNLFD